MVLNVFNNYYEYTADTGVTLKTVNRSMAHLIRTSVLRWDAIVVSPSKRVPLSVQPFHLHAHLIRSSEKLRSPNALLHFNSHLHSIY